MEKTPRFWDSSIWRDRATARRGRFEIEALGPLCGPTLKARSTRFGSAVCVEADAFVGGGLGGFPPRRSGVKVPEVVEVRWKLLAGYGRAELALKSRGITYGFVF